MGGRLTLINNVLDNIPTYWMSSYPMPSADMKQIDRLRRKFLWEGNNWTHKYSLVKWTKVTQPKSQRRFGIRNLKHHNKSMLMKWLLRYGQNKEWFWKRVISANMEFKITGVPGNAQLLMGLGSRIISAAIAMNCSKMFSSKLPCVTSLQNARFLPSKRPQWLLIKMRLGYKIHQIDPPNRLCDRRVHRRTSLWSVKGTAKLTFKTGLVCSSLQQVYDPQISYAVA